jgi:diaminohydroxyphosphoribosylaminopyrimidine deaminase/5-amino-6-(5-phosphoribosylamino)uracil reductase
VEQDILFMQRAMELAKLGLGKVSPNPLVGCVIVARNKIIGEGWHRKYGEGHAEVNALNSVADSLLLPEATVYVNLEPCSHFGKTPPCSDRLIEAGVKRAVISNRDSNPLVSGKGIEKLRNAGIEVTLGVLENEGRTINKRFFTTVEQGTPYIILKWAESADGFIARKGEATVISSSHSKQRVHQWRAEEDAVLVGSHTAEIDNPQLSVRDWTGRNPVRVVIDRSLRLNKSLRIFDQSQPTLCYNLQRNEQLPNLSYVKIDEEDFIKHLLVDLLKRKVGSLLVEGGAQTLEAFITSGLWHEARIFRSKKSLGGGIQSLRLAGVTEWEDDISQDHFSVVRNPKPPKK